MWLLSTLKRYRVFGHDKRPFIVIIDATVRKSIDLFFGILDKNSDVVTSLYQVCDEYGVVFSQRVASIAAIAKRRWIQVKRYRDRCTRIILNFYVGNFATGNTL